MAVGAPVSGLVGLVAASLPAGTRVLVPDIEFTSNLFPFMVQADRGVEVGTVPLDAARRRDRRRRVDVVAFSVVQTSTGEVADLDAIVAAAAAHDVITVVDATQAVGWLPLDATRFDFLARGRLQVADVAARDGVDDGRARAARRDRARRGASWFAGGEPYDAFYGPPLRLADDARRFDVSPAWFSWVGSVPALELLRRGRRSRRSTRTTSGWRTGSARGWGWSRATPRS